MHCMIPQLVSVAYEILQRRLVSCDLRSDDKKGRGCTICVKDLHDLVGVLGWPIVDCKRDDLRRRRYAPEDVWPPTLKILYQKSGRFIDHVERRNQDAHET